MANNTSQLQITSLDFDSIKQNFITYLQSQSQFADYNFQGSSFNVLLDILAYNTFYNAFYMNMIANEMFLDSAALRSSVISQAKTIGYTPRSSTAAEAIVDLTITKVPSDHTTSLNVPRFTQFAAKSLTGTSYSFYTVDDSEYEANNGTTFTFNSLVIKEGVPTKKSFLYSSATNPSQYFDLVDRNIDTSTLQVIVQNSTTNPTYNVYTLAEDATQVSANSNVYYIEEGPNQNYLIYFGDGILGKSLVDQNIITVSYLITNADAANELQIFQLQSNLLDGSVPTVSTLSSSSGGSPIENIDSIKFSAPKSFISQNRIVTKNDYITQINKKYPYFDAINVWGGDEINPPVYGKVFISAKPKNGFAVTTNQQNYLINEILKPLSVLTVTAEYVPADYDYINFSLIVNYDPTKTTLTQQQLATAIANTVATYTNNNLNTFNGTFKYSKFLSAIDSTDQSIESSSATIYLQKQIFPTLGESQTYNLNFGTPLHQGVTNDRLYSSPYFIALDAAGNEQQCYIEETPFSYGGITTVTIESPGYNYTTPPTIIIEGDGLGANAYPMVVNGQINSIVIDNSGNNYTTAAIVLEGGGGGTGAVLIPIISGQTGKLRTYYFDTNNVKQILNANAGTINYLTGEVTLNNFYPISIGGTQSVLSIYAQPYSQNFSTNNQIVLTYDENNSAALSVTVNMIRS
jgi:hypothetical protein